MRAAVFLLLAAGTGSEVLAQTGLRFTTNPQLPAGRVNTPYAITLAVTGGRAPYVFAVTQGSLPPGLTLQTLSGDIEGTPTAAGDYSFTIGVLSFDGQTATRGFRLLVQPPTPPVAISTASLAAATRGSPYTATLSATGGTPPYTWSIASGSLPQGITLSPAGELSGTPTATGTFTFDARVTDSASGTATRSLQLVVNAPPPSITTASLANGQVGTAYSQTLAATGGTPPYSWSVAAGSLPSGLSMSSAGAITGTPTASGASAFTARVADSGGQSATRELSITIAPPALSITTASVPNGQVGTPYSATLAAAGGAPPYSWAIAAGALPAGLSLAPSGTISGTPTSAGTAGVTVRVTDQAGQNATRDLSITVAAPQLSVSTSSVPSAQVGTAYSTTLAASGGTPPYSWSVSAGALPAGLSLAPTGAITGTPTAAGTSNFTVRAADNGGQEATRALSITVAPAPPPTLTVATTSLPNAQVGTPYTQTLAATGGTPPYSWTVTSGSLPAGLSLAASGSLSGTPSAAGNSTFTVAVADNSGQNATRSLSISVAAAPPPALTISTTSLPNAQVGADYNQTLAAAGGTAPYAWSISAGSLPAGLSLSRTGAITGRPTTAGSFGFTVRASDNAGQNATADLTITVTAAPPPALNITSASVAGGQAGVAYSQTLAAAGGTPPYTWSLAGGTLPAGLTLGSNGTISGTPATAGTAAFTARVADNGGRSATRDFTLTIAAASVPLSIVTTAAATGQVGTPYAQTLSATGGTAPYTWIITGGGLPPGLTMAPNGSITGTPLSGGNYPFSVRVADAAGQNASRQFLISVASPLRIVTEILPDATTQAPYSSVVSAIGGIPPYRWFAIAGSVPPGLTLNEGTGLINGTPIAIGQFSFTLRANDASGAFADRAYTINVSAALAIPACPSSVASVGRPYTSTVTAIGGQAPYTWSVSAGNLPGGITLSESGGTLAGSPTAAGQFDFALSAADAAGGSATRQCRISVAPQLALSPAAPPGATSGSQYDAGLTASGGTPPYVWSISNGALPPGLSLNASTGRITGTAGQAGTYRFTIRVADAAGNTIEAQHSIEVAGAFAITQCPAAGAVGGESYSSAFASAGGEAPIRWSVLTGALPSGLTLGPETGTVTGTPSQQGSFEFVVRAQDRNNFTATRSCTLVVGTPGLRIQNESLPDVTLGSAYSLSLEAAGGIAPYQWAVIDGRLPGGLSLSPGGVLTGSTDALGTFTFTVRVQDSARGMATRAFSINVAPAPAPNVSFGDMPETLPAAQQPRLRLALDGSYPSALRGRVTLRFIPEPGIDVDDKSIQFVTGGRTVDFQVPAGATDVQLPVPQLAIQTGTVAGTIELSVRLLAGDADVTPDPVPVKRFRIERSVPVISSVRVNRTANGFELLITGYSTSRDVSAATFVFTTAEGRLESNEVTIVTADAARRWYSNPASADYGSQFTFTQPFTVSNVSLAEVSVTLTNGQGTSAPVRARF